jgi:hypothetical protein
MADAKQFIYNEIAPKTRTLFPRICRQAYNAVDLWVQENEWLQIPTVQKGHLRAWALDYALIQAINSGSWPTRKYEWCDFTRPTGKYLKIFTPNGVLTVSQLPDPKSQPRHAVFRENAAFRNQPFLFPEFAPDVTEDLPHLILTHGYQDLTFIQIGMPHPDDNGGWLATTPNLLDEIHETASDLAPAEAVGIEPVLKIKEQLAKRIAANDR